VPDIEDVKEGVQEAVFDTEPVLEGETEEENELDRVAEFDVDADPVAVTVADVLAVLVTV
jgi:hypothetical protein